jgi:hypothetical protein
MYEAPVPGKYISMPPILCTLLMRTLFGHRYSLSREHGHDVVRVFKVRMCIVNDKADAARRLLAGAVRARPGDVARQNRGHILDQRAAHAFWSLSVIRTRSGAELKEEKACLGHLQASPFEPHGNLVQQAGPVTAAACVQQRQE